jgi:hypothetical protein
MASKPSIPKGTRDFHLGGGQKTIIQIIKNLKFGFQPIETSFKLGNPNGKREEATV